MAKIVDWLSLPIIFLRGRDWDFGETVAQYGPFHVHRTAFVLRNGQRALPGYDVIFGELPTPLRFSLWAESRDKVLKRHGCIRVGNIDLHGESATVVDVYRHVRRWLRSQETMIAVFRESHRGEDFRNAADRTEIQSRIVREGVQALRAEYPELDDVQDDEATRKKEERLQRRLRRWLRLAFSVLPKLQRPMQWIGKRRPLRWLFRNQIGAMHEASAEQSGEASERNQYRDRIVELGWAIRLDPDNARAYYNRGLAYWNLAQYDRAVADYTEAIRLNPAFPAAYQNRGTAYDALGEHEQAINDITEAIRLNPDEASEYFSRGIAFCHLEQYDRAVTDFSEAIRLEADYTRAYSSRGLAYYHLSQLESAIVDLDEAIRLDGDDATTHYNRGIIYRDLAKYEQAISDFADAILLNPTYVDAYHNRGYTYYKLRQYDEAIADFDELIRINPEDMIARQNRDAAHRAQGI